MSETSGTPSVQKNATKKLRFLIPRVRCQKIRFLGAAKKYCFSKEELPKNVFSGKGRTAKKLSFWSAAGTLPKSDVFGAPRGQCQKVTFLEQREKLRF